MSKTEAEIRHAHGSRRARFRDELKDFRHLGRQLAKADAGRLPALAGMTVTGPHFLMDTYEFCVTSP